MEQKTDVWSLSCQGLEGREAIQGRRGHVVEEDTDIVEAKKPGRWRAAREFMILLTNLLAAHPPLILSLVLVLMIGFRLVISNKE